MSWHGLTLFCLVYCTATATPGPGIAALVARVLGREVVAVRNEGRLQAFAGAVALTLGNPKVMVFFLAVQWLNRASGTVMAGAAAGVAAQ
jgi:threonine/homoserine/homoserine lactone efflux protein